MISVLHAMSMTKNTIGTIINFPVSALEHVLCVNSIHDHQPGKRFSLECATRIPYPVQQLVRLYRSMYQVIVLRSSKSDLFLVFTSLLPCVIALIIREGGQHVLQLCELSISLTRGCAVATREKTTVLVLTSARIVYLMQSSFNAVVWNIGFTLWVGLAT